MQFLFSSSSVWLQPRKPLWIEFCLVERFLKYSWVFRLTTNCGRKHRTLLVISASFYFTENIFQATWRDKHWNEILVKWNVIMQMMRKRCVSFLRTNNSLNFMLFYAIMAHYCFFLHFSTIKLYLPNCSCNSARAFPQISHFKSALTKSWINYLQTISKQSSK